MAILGLNFLAYFIEVPLDTSRAFSVLGHSFIN